MTTRLFDGALNQPWLLDDALIEEAALAEWPPHRVAAALRAGMYVTDEAFDQVLPFALQEVSRRHWTPLHVATRAAAWLDALNIKCLVDIGSGAGKLCVGIALTSRCQLIGVEQRPHLVAAARDLARTYGVEDRIEFIEGTFGKIHVPEADAYYFYNPFGENLFGPEDHLDEAVELNVMRYERDISAVETFLRMAPVGTYVLTYNGFGGQLPGSYRELQSDHHLPNVLQLCQKVRRSQWDRRSQ